MRSGSILNQFFHLIIGVTILLQVTGCGSLQQQNFHKQKYLHGKLKPVYDENQKTNTDLPEETVNDAPLRNETDQSILSSENKNESFDEITSAEKPAEENESLSEPVRQIKKEKKINPPGSKTEEISNPIKQVIQKKMPAAPNIGVRVVWVLILAGLSLLALPLALLIGFWAFIIAGILLLAAAILVFFTDYGNDFLHSLFVVIFISVLIVVLCIAAIIALIWFIIWGIIQLVN